MQLDVRGVAAMLNVRESTVYRWIRDRRMPANGVEGQYRFGREELLEWATAHKVHVSPEIFAGFAGHSLLHDALEAGGIFYDVAGTDKATALRSVVERIPLPRGCSADLILQLFLAREAMGSTAVQGGVAIPHPRHPVVLPVTEPMLSVCFLASPIDFGAPSGELVHTLFVLLTPTIPIHLQMLAHIARLLRDERFSQALAARKAPQELLNEVRRVETTCQNARANGSEH